MLRDCDPPTPRRFRRLDYKIGFASILIACAAALGHAQTPPSWAPKVRAWIGANQDPVVRQLLELLASCVGAMVAWLLFKLCETLLIQSLTR